MRGNMPFTLRDKKPDHACLKPAAEAKPIDYPKPDNVITFDRLSSVFLSNTNHEEDQPCHLQLMDSVRADSGQSTDLRRARSALLPGWCIRGVG